MLLQLKLDVGVRVLEDALNDTERCICEIEMKRRMYFLRFLILRAVPVFWCWHFFILKLQRRVLLQQ